jgi:alpha-1,3-rhamnosyl/mannosyltransferase
MHGAGSVEAKTDINGVTAGPSVVAFDLRSATGRPTGTGRHLLSLALAATDLPEIKVRVYLGRNDLDLPPAVEKVAFRTSGLRWHLAVWRHLRAHSVDTYVSTSLIIPALPLVKALPVVLDVSCFRVPRHQKRRTRLFERVLLGRVVRRHPLIFGTEAAGSDVKDLFPRARGTVVPPWFPERPSFAGAETVLDQLGVSRPYLLIVGTVEPRKNVSLAVRATRELRARGHDLHLVIVGSRGWASPEEIEEIHTAQADGVVVWPGYVPNEARDALYASASALLLPSIYEGFGMPLVEAMDAGLPCVCSAIPVFLEVADGAALTADPANPLEWADRLEELIMQLDPGQAPGGGRPGSSFLLLPRANRAGLPCRDGAEALSPTS